MDPVVAASPSLDRSWYFVAKADALSRGPHTVVVADRLLTLRRGPDGRPEGRRAGRAIPVCAWGPLLLAWLGAGPPTFTVEPIDWERWTPLRWFHLDLPTSPATVMRDLADLPHFEAIHGYADVRVEQEPCYRDDSFSTRMAFGWDTGIAGRHVAARFDAHVTGMGLQRTEVVSLAGRLHSRHLVMPTPRLGGITRVHAACSVKLTGRGPLARAKTRALRVYLERAFIRDVGRDAQLWQGLSAYRPEDTPRLRAYRSWRTRFRPAAAP